MVFFAATFDKPMFPLMLSILGTCEPFKIGGRVACFISVDVIHSQPDLIPRNEGHSYHSVNVEPAPLVSRFDPYHKISVGVKVWRQNLGWSYLRSFFPGNDKPHPSRFYPYFPAVRDLDKLKAISGCFPIVHVGLEI